MTKGGVPSTVDTTYVDAATALADPAKKIELLDKRATWVFGSVGLVGTVLAAFTFLGGTAPIASRFPLLAVAIVVLTLVAILAAGSTQFVTQAEGHFSDPDEARTYLDRLTKQRRRRVQAAVGSLLLAILLAGVGAAVAVKDRVQSSMALEWTSGTDGSTMNVAAQADGIPPDQAVRARVYGTRADKPDEDLYLVTAEPDGTGTTKFDGEIKVKVAYAKATLTLSRRSAGEADWVEFGKVEVDPPATAATATASTSDLVQSTSKSIGDYFGTQLDGIDATASRSFGKPTAQLFDSRQGRVPGCDGPIDPLLVADNAFYCEANNVISIDAKLIDGAVGADGPSVVGAILAHEWGHAVQKVIAPGLAGRQAELHADCLAGSWAGSAEAAKERDKARRVDAMLALVADDGAAAVPGEDRMAAFTAGADHGITTCQQYVHPGATPGSAPGTTVP